MQNDSEAFLIGVIVTIAVGCLLLVAAGIGLIWGTVKLVQRYQRRRPRPYYDLGLERRYREHRP